MPYCDCANLPTEIVDIPLYNCAHQIGQIHKLVLQRFYSTGTTRNEFTVASANPNLIASWSTFLDAEDGTKAVQTPTLGAPTITAGGIITYGGGNDTPGGVEIIMGEEQSSFDGRFNQQHADTLLAMKKYKCENIAAYFVNEDGFIIGQTEPGGTTKFRPFRLYSWFLGSRNVPGKTEPDYNVIQFKLPQGWADYLTFVEPSDFDAKLDLVASA